MKFVESTMQAVCAGFQDDIGDRSAGASELGLIVTGADVDVLDSLNRRYQDRQQTRAVVVVDALDLDVVGEA